MNASALARETAKRCAEQDWLLDYLTILNGGREGSLLFVFAKQVKPVDYQGSSFSIVNMERQLKEHMSSRVHRMNQLEFHQLFDCPACEALRSIEAATCAEQSLRHFKLLWVVKAWEA